MRSRVSLFALAFLFLVAGNVLAQEPNQRHFKFTYAFSVRSPQKGRPLKIWFPIATSDAWQKVALVSAKGDLPLKHTRESEYGDNMYYAFTPKAEKDEYHFEVVYDVVRTERVGLANGHPIATGPQLRTASLQRFLSADKLVPITGTPAELAIKETQGATDDMQKARAIYDYVFRTMRYDKSGTGWGRGDTLWACDAKHGNCTDFHSVFASMARSQNIPVRFAIGFPLPVAKHAGEIPGYHCWADFYAEKGWVPVDISEAWKDQSKKDYFFGHHDVNRVQFSIGRDIRLGPPQAGPPLNYFVYPYVESDGKIHQNVSNAFSFEDVGTSLQAQLK